MKKVFFFLALATGFASANAQMSVTITGSTSGSPLSIVSTVAATPYNGYGVSCGLSSTNSGIYTNANGSITGTITGGSSTYTYKLYEGSLSGTLKGTDAISTDLSSTFNNLTGSNVGTGTLHTLQVTDVNGCEVVSTARITAPADLTASVSQTQEDKCQINDGKATVTISGGVVNTVTPGATTSNGGAGYDITWTATASGAGSPVGTTATLNTTGTQVYSGLTGGSIYSFVVTDDNGCVVQ